MKKIFSMFVAVALVLTMTLSVVAAESVGEKEIVLRNGSTRISYASLSINDIDGLKRNQAYLMEDYDTVNRVTNELYKNGMSKISIEELYALTGEENEIISRSGAIFETVYSTYRKASSSVTVVTPTLTYGTNGAITSAVTKTYSGSATPTNYYSTAKAVEGYFGGVYTDAKVSKIVIKGIEGKTVKTINLLNPEIPALID